MQTLIGIALLLRLGFAQGISPSLGSIRVDVFSKGTNGEPAVLPGARIVLRGPVTKETELDTQGAFAIDGLPPETYEIEANASHLFAALPVEVSAGASSNIPCEMNVAAITSTMSTQLTQLKAMDCAFRRKVHHV
jgi:hypothetical protein